MNTPDWYRARTTEIMQARRAIALATTNSRKEKWRLAWRRLLRLLARTHARDTASTSPAYPPRMMRRGEETETY
jgi:hypothetical protein